MFGLKILILMVFVLSNSGHSPVHGARILAIFTLASPSHNIFNRVLSRALASRGHEVTEICPDVDKQPTPNRTTILIERAYDMLHSKYNYGKSPEKSTLEIIHKLTEIVEFYCELQLSSKGVKQLLNSQPGYKFDLIIVEASLGGCLYGFITKFGSPPVVVISSHGMFPWLSTLMGTPENPSYMPNYFLPYSSRMTFGERIHNYIIHSIFTFYYKYSIVSVQESVARKHFRETLLPYLDIQRNFSLLLANIAVGLDEPRPLSSNVIPVGGMHIKSRHEPLPQILQDFLDGAQGFIYFSLGVSIKGEMIDSEKLKLFVDAFSELPLRILWKFETNKMGDLPSNIRIEKWLPQDAILAHPNIRMFITHCGRLSMLEAVYRGVPVVGIPLIMDQPSNLKLILDRKGGVHLDYHTLSKESILQAVKKVLGNKSYAVNMKKLSTIFRDQADTALDRAVFWTEYVIRHKGAPHLRPASTELHWHQYLLLDVILVIVFALVITFLITRCMLMSVIRRMKAVTLLRKKTN
ncbi:UDP-glucosyltransferase 2-like [Periplaneta americana]|uniref:UDP-glucosyltransferase 2-like n=1 Tax=Periplaneta americana TaxID=6978 RepID=UPI0037E89372